MKRKLLFRMILAYILFGLLGFIAISTFSARYNENYLEEKNAQSLRRECSAIATNYASSYLSSDITLEEFQAELSTFSKYLDADIYIIDTRGRILVNSSAYVAPSDIETIEDFDILNFGNKYYTVGNFYDRYDQPMLSVYTTISSSYKTSSYVVICKSIHSISDMQYDLLNGSYLTLLILLLLSLLILLIFMFAIYRPLYRMIRASAAYSAGDFSKPINIHSNNEVGALAKTMDYMAMELNTLEDDQRKFVSNVSHDFRSPLTSIKGYATAMADGTIPVELQEKYLNIIVFETERLEKLTQELLELNQYSSKGSYLDISTFDLNELIHRTVITFEGQSYEKRISFDLILTGEQLFVKADASKIDQVLHNLIDNAIKFSDTNSTITIETTARNEKVFISVKDTGIGIPKESLSKVWERFYKTDLSRGKDKKGTGLGLAIVKEIIHAHRENINVISTVGVGTEFIFSLPIAREEGYLQGEVIPVDSDM